MITPWEAKGRWGADVIGYTPTVCMRGEPMLRLAWERGMGARHVISATFHSAVNVDSLIKGCVRYTIYLSCTGSKLETDPLPWIQPSKHLCVYR